MTGIKKIDTNNDGRVSDEEFKKFWQINKAKSAVKVSTINQESKYKGVEKPHTAMDFSNIADAKEPVDPDLVNIQKLFSQLDSVKEETKRETIKAQIKAQMVNMEEKGKQVPKTLALPDTKGGLKERSTQFNGQSIGGKSMSFNAASAKAQTLEMGSPKAASFEVPDGWGDPSGNSLDVGALIENSYMKEEFVGKAMDSINENTKKGKQLMMLFFYYAKLAESGDMGAMYQFMKFITYIVSKDKAKQQIEMGKKLIELQELSRQWTNTLVNAQSSSTDPNASSELMKTMTIVKSETDAIATSQKLISQMMEEFGQVVETLTNTTKSAFDFYRRIMATVSQPK